MNAVALRTDWSESFWNRFYNDPATRICTPEDLLGEGLWLGLTLSARLGLPIRNAIDIGSGNGIFTDGLDQALKIQTKRIDPYAPDPRAVPDDGDRQADLIVCRDVLHYLDIHEAVRVLLSLRNSPAKALYVRVACKGDDISQESDTEIALRSHHWYRGMLENFVHLGFGLHIRQGVVLNRGVFE